MGNISSCDLVGGKKIALGQSFSTFLHLSTSKMGQYNHLDLKPTNFSVLLFNFY